jgi:anti-anti-sigma factor
MSQDQQERIAIDPQASSQRVFTTELFAEADRIIVTAQGRLDFNTRPTLVATLAKAIATNQREIVIDLTGLDSVDSEDVGLLVRARSLLQSRGQHLIVRSPCPNAEVLVACALLEPFARVEHVDDNRAGLLGTSYDVA